VRYIGVMCLRIALCLLVAGCSNDVFVGGDGGATDGGDATVADATRDAHDGLPDALGVEGGPTVAVHCGSMECSSPNAVCCGAATWSSESCVPSSGCQTAGSHPLTCDDTTDCGSDMCCGAVVNVGGVNYMQSSTCRSTCQSGELQLCRSGGECKSTNCAPITNGTPNWLEACQ
jgi:hypothetical protein